MSQLKFGMIISAKYQMPINDEEELIKKIKSGRYNAGDLQNASEKALSIAIKQNPHVIKYIDNPSETIKLAAVTKDGCSIQYIDNPSEAVQLAAIKSDPRAINLLAKDHNIVVKNDVIQSCKDDIIKFTLKLISKGNNYGYKAAAFIVNMLHDRNIDWPELDVIKRSLEADRLMEAIDYNNLSEEEQINLVKKDPYDIRYIKTPSLKVQLAAVQKTGYAIQFIKNPFLEVQLAAVERDGRVIYFIKTPSLEVQLAAVQQDGYALQYIKNPSKDVVITAMLKLMQRGGHSDYLIELINKYDNNNWPELDIIKTSLRAEGKIK